jgi:hypothetical protein
MNSKVIENGNLEIARMLGWFQQEGQVGPNAWFQTEETGNVIATIHGLRFNSNWNDLMIALAFIEGLGFNTNIHHYYTDTNANQHSVIFNKENKIFFEHTLLNKSVEWNNNNSTKKEVLFLTVFAFASQYNNAEMLKKDLKE